MNVDLRSDNTFVEDKGWNAAQNRYADFLRRHDGLNILFLELGVGANTPVRKTKATIFVDLNSD